MAAAGAAQNMLKPPSSGIAAQTHAGSTGPAGSTPTLVKEP
eukprot:CAMPEP_0170645132 /NCGR_PEP_ID=MMETSP0224-20130122/42891_1 /TAXON_ID=285029 /ORGANISM="Togula jolla, Strain CCCM 725" /LENGTH=40 /DNA_ID= /DNA_START= /DNA_END= /DNA_ORIENTATION=